MGLGFRVEGCGFRVLLLVLWFFLLGVEGLFTDKLFDFNPFRVVVLGFRADSI